MKTVIDYTLPMAYVMVTFCNTCTENILRACIQKEMVLTIFTRITI